MRKLLPLIILYVLVHASEGDSVRAYSGYDAAPNVLLSSINSDGLSGSFISEKEYQVFVEAHKPLPPTPDPAKAQAKIDLNTKSKTDVQRIDAIIKYLDLDK